MAYQVLAPNTVPNASRMLPDRTMCTVRWATLWSRSGWLTAIFQWDRGIGKTTIARILAMALNCRNKIGSAQRPTPSRAGFATPARRFAPATPWT